MKQDILDHRNFDAHKDALSDLINLAGKQRTLSHQVLLCAAMIAMQHENAPDDIVARMAAAREEFDEIADILTVGSEEAGIPASAIEYMWSSGCVDHAHLDQIREFQRRTNGLFNQSPDGGNAVITRDWVFANEEYVSGPLLEALSNLTFGVRNALNQLIDIEHKEADTNRRLINTATNELKRTSNAVQMLAINAKVESHRLGDDGKPMQFVADEMTKLSKNVREFSHKISNYIDD